MYYHRKCKTEIEEKSLGGNVFYYCPNCKMYWSSLKFYNEISTKEEFFDLKLKKELK